MTYSPPSTGVISGGDTTASAEAFIARLHGACAAIRSLPVPVIARISGYCLGGGLEVAASCDLRVASEDSTFGMPEVNVGIPSVIEAALLPRLVGWGKARELVYTGLSISAAEAVSCGLVERVGQREVSAAVVEFLVLRLGVGQVLGQGGAIRLGLEQFVDPRRQGVVGLLEYRQRVGGGRFGAFVGPGIASGGFVLGVL